MIAKALFLAETFYRYRVRIFRDHESRPTEYPGGYLYQAARLATPGIRTEDLGHSSQVTLPVAPQSRHRGG